MTSLWNSVTKKTTNFSSLKGNIKADIVIIGAGMAGILTAYLLQKKGYSCVILEAAKIEEGQTHHTTAKLTVQHGLIYQKLFDLFPLELGRQYYEANLLGLKKYQEIIQDKKIDCDFTQCPSFLYSLKNAELLEKEFAAAQQLGIDAFLTTDTELPFPIAQALTFNNQAHFNPLKFLYALADDLKIYEHSKVVAVDDNEVITETGKVRAQQIVFACHYPFINIPGYYFARLHQERSYVLAVKNAIKFQGIYLGIDADGLSFRSYKDFLLIGGGSHRTGENSAGGKYRILEETVHKYWPQASIISSWSAQDCISIDGLPYIGQFASSKPNWYVATGFNKWGMTTSMVAAMLISELIQNGKSPYEEVFSPQRFAVSASAKSLIKDVGQSVKGLSRRFLEPPRAMVENLPCGHGGIVEVEGEKVGVYKDDQGQIFVISPKCPHLGCQLEWNPDEKSWDCPCHGSRFDYFGNLIDNPAQENLLVKNYQY